MGQNHARALPQRFSLRVHVLPKQVKGFVFHPVTPDDVEPLLIVFQGAINQGVTVFYIGRMGRVGTEGRKGGGRKKKGQDDRS